MELNTLNPTSTGGKRSGNHIVDTTLLLSANSALYQKHSSHLYDKDSEKAFKDLITLITSGKKFDYIRPEFSKVKCPFPMYELILSSEEPLNTIGLKPEGDNQAWSEAARDFEVYINTHNSIDIFNWVRFQFHDYDLVQVFYDGGEDAQINRLLRAYEVLKDNTTFKKLKKLWKNTGSLLSIPEGRHQEVAQVNFKDFYDFSLAYAFFGFAKGQFYPIRLGLDCNQPNCQHWLRRIASDMLFTRRGTDALSDDEKRSAKPKLYFDWGSVLFEIIKRDDKFKSLQWLQPTVQKLRDESQNKNIEKFMDEIVDEIANTKKNKKKRKNIVEEVREFAMKSLLKTEYEPLLINEKNFNERKQKFTRIATAAIGASIGYLSEGLSGGLFGGFGGIVLSKLTNLPYLLPRNWYYELDKQLVRRFTRENLYRCYDTKDIDPAVREIVNKYYHRM